MNPTFEKKKIILAITQDMKIYECFVENLENLNFEVFLIDNYSGGLKYKNIFHRLHNLYRKTFFNDKDFKKKLFKKYLLDSKLNTLNEIKSIYDYSLTIRADLFDEIVIKKVIEKSKKNYAYQWDGLNRFPDIYRFIKYFDKFYIFDKSDLEYEHKTHLITNFYFDCYNSLFDNIEPEYDAYYIGSYDDRFEKLIQICELLKSKGLKLNVILCGKVKKDLSPYPYIKVIHNPLSYYENLKMVANSKILIDIHHENIHKGLSFRSFEAIGYNKKLITTNTIIKKYDFYDQDNIHLIDNNIISFDEFLNKENKEIDPQIKKKYSFTHWINYILEEKNVKPMEIP